MSAMTKPRVPWRRYRQLAFWQAVLARHFPLGFVRLLDAATLYPVDRSDPNHDACMRIGGELRGGAPILNGGTKAMAWHGTPPPRTIIAPPSRARDWKRTVFQMLSIEMKAHDGRIWTPSGTMPSCARRQSAIKSLRARATISVLRIAGAACVRCRYHSASALSFCSHSRSSVPCYTVAHIWPASAGHCGRIAAARRYARRR